MDSFELYGYSFRLRKLSAFEQLHLSRKVAPLLPPLAPLIIKMQEKIEADEKAKQASDSSDIKLQNRKDSKLFSSDEVLYMSELAGPFTDALAGMADQDAEDILVIALTSVDVMSDLRTQTWIKLWPKGAKAASVIELDDIGKLLTLTVRVIIHNLANFMDGLLTNRSQEIPESNGGPSPAVKTFS